MSRILVTGISGLLGINLAWLASGRHQISGVLSGGRAVPSPDGRLPFDTLVADLRQAGQVERVLDATQPDAVIHCAALTDVDRCEIYPEEADCLNHRLPRVLARACASRGVRLVHISTDAVFDGQSGDYTESDEPRPINVYARTKLDGERAVAEGDPDALIARVNFYGWSWHGQRSLSEWFFYNLSAGRGVLGFTDLVFCPLLVNDLVEILLQMLERRLSGLYHVVSAEPLTKFAFGRMLARQFGLDERLVHPASFLTGGLKALRSPQLNLCTGKLARALDRPLPVQEPAMRRYYELYCQQYPQQMRSLFVRAGTSIET